MSDRQSGPSGYRRSLAGAQNQWRAVEAVLQQQKKQRFRPPKPERPLCKRFSLPEGCPFHDECTHLHSLDGIHDVRDTLQVAHPDPGGTAGTVGTAPRVFLHKMEDRKVGKGSISLIIRTLATGGFVQTSEPGDADLVLANAFPSSNLLSKIPPGCTINHFPGEHELCCKDRMAKLLRGMPFCPETFILPEEEKRFEAVLSDEPESIWILKPCQLGEGRHIEIVQGLNLVQTPERRQRLQRCTASRYIANPLLIEGRKVDLRVYVVVTQLSPVLGALIFREGLVRFCSGSYREAGLEELGAHISNNAVQTKTTRHASGQNWTLEQLWCHLSKIGICPETVWRRIIRTARDALTLWQTKALAYVTDVTTHTNVHSYKCYSLMALDLLIDDSGAVWLLEANSKPALHAQSASLKAIFPVHFAVKAALLSGTKTHFCP